MSEGCLSDFVAKAQAALAEYSKLRFVGVPHEVALHQSGFYEAIVQPDKSLRFDPKLAQTGERE